MRMPQDAPGLRSMCRARARVPVMATTTPREATTRHTNASGATGAGRLLANGLEKSRHRPIIRGCLRSARATTQVLSRRGMRSTASDFGTAARANSSASRSRRYRLRRVMVSRTRLWASTPRCAVSLRNLLASSRDDGVGFMGLISSWQGPGVSRVAEGVQHERSVKMVDSLWVVPHSTEAFNERDANITSHEPNQSRGLGQGTHCIKVS